MALPQPAWVRLGNDYLNLGQVADAVFLRDADGTLSATAELASGTVKHYRGREAEALQEALEALAQGRPPADPRAPA